MSNGTGDCFEAAVLTAAKIPRGDGRTISIVHGVPRNRGPEHYGRRFWHAWVELEIEIMTPPEVAWPRLTTTIVVDHSNGLEVEIPQASFYQLGDLDEPWVWRFSFWEAIERMQFFQHYGPWVYGWQLLEEV